MSATICLYWAYILVLEIYPIRWFSMSTTGSMFTCVSYKRCITSSMGSFMPSVTGGGVIS